MEPGTELPTSEFRSATEPGFEPPPPPPHLDASRRAVWTLLARRMWARLRLEPLLLVAGGVALFAILSLMPAIAATVAVYGLVASPADIQAQVEPLSRVVPPEVVTLVAAQLSAAAETPGAALGLAFAVSLGLALLGASTGIRAFMTALNTIHRMPEGRSFLRQVGMSFALGVGGVLTVVVTVGLVVLLPTALRLLNLEESTALILSLARWPALVLLVMTAVALLYRLGPVVRPTHILPGAAVATVLWTLGSVLLSFYVDRVANYSGLYGAFGGVMIVILWFFVSSLVILLGALLNEELEQARALSRPDSAGSLPRPRPGRYSRAG